MRLNKRLILSFGITLSVLCILKLASQKFGSQEVSNNGNRPTNKDENSKENLIESCYYDPSCPNPQLLFRIHAETLNSPPNACLNDIQLFEHSKIAKGINIAVLNGTTADIVEVNAFDVSSSDEKLITWLRRLPAESVIVAVSFGDIAARVSLDARVAFAEYGASDVHKWHTGYAYALVGQRGLKEGLAHEQLVAEGSSTVNFLEGCFDLPLGELTLTNISSEANVHRLDEEKLAEFRAFSAPETDKKKAELGKEWINCGMEKACSIDEIPMYFFSGEHKDDFPRMCVGGRMVFDRSLNGAGRGLNFVSVEPKTGQIRAAANFDTYVDDTTALENFLDSIPNGDIVAAVSFDEASTTLSDMAKQILYEMGSSMINRLKFRASWYFVGQKRIAGYSPFEDLNIPSGNAWAKPIKKSLCIPRILSQWGGGKQKKSVNPSSVVRNLPKRHFCAKHDKHEDFCNVGKIDEPILPKSLVDEKLKGHMIFNTPILVVAGLDVPSLRKTLQSLLQQEGINTQMILVAYDMEYPENADLASLFHAQSLPINATDGYGKMVDKAIRAASSIFSVAPALIVIEEEVTLSPDWLFFFSQTLDVLLNDDSLDLVQAFNPNGYVNTSSREDVVYRIAYQPPLYSYMLSRKIIESEILKNLNCCSELGRWRFHSASALVPEVSRVFVIPPVVLPRHMLWKKDLFGNKRSHSTGTKRSLIKDYVSKIAYVAAFEQLLKQSVVINQTDFVCNEWNEKSSFKTRALAIQCDDEFSSLKTISDCFGLYFDVNFVSGVYQRIIRFFAHDITDVFIVPKGSVFSKSLIHNRPDNSSLL